MARSITLFTGQWTDLQFEEICKKANSWGYDGLEIACLGDHMDVNQANSDKNYISNKKNILDRYNLKCFCLGTHLSGQCIGDSYDVRLNTFVPDNIKGKTEEIKKWAISDFELSVNAANKMGCKVVTGFMGSPIWKYWYSFPPTTEQMIEQGYNEIYELWSPIFDKMDRLDVRFALEVHPAEIAFDVYTTKRLLEVFKNRTTLGINFDPSHLVWQGMDPVLFIREFSDRIYHVHVKDVAVRLDGKSSILCSFLPFGDSRRGWNFRSPGHGDVNFDDIIRELNSIKYSGPLSIEWEDNNMDREYGAKEAARFIKKLNFNPSDVPFDKDMKK